MKNTDYLNIVFDALVGRSIVTSASQFSKDFLGSSSKSYYATCRAREAIGPGSLINLAKALKRHAQDDLAGFVGQVIEAERDV
jgi:uncharacterized protein YbjQ (UPF0145 family)